jgi:hypothetical protein
METRRYIALARLINTNVPQVLDDLNYTNLPNNWSYGDFPDGQPFYRNQMFFVTPGATNNSALPPITVFVNEWMADNASIIANPYGGKFDDWFELYNPGTNTVDLGGYYLTGALTNKTKFQIPNNGHYLIPPHGFILVWADNNNAQNSTNRPELHVNFKLSKSGESIGLFSPDGPAIDALSFGGQTTDVTEGRYPDGTTTIRTMPTPTPGAPNIVPNTPQKTKAEMLKFQHVSVSEFQHFSFCFQPWLWRAAHRVNQRVQRTIQLDARRRARDQLSEHYCDGQRRAQHVRDANVPHQSLFAANPHGSNERRPDANLLAQRNAARSGRSHRSLFGCFRHVAFHGEPLGRQEVFPRPAVDNQPESKDNNTHA